jgi:hypothetical protein
VQVDIISDPAKFRQPGDVSRIRRYEDIMEIKMKP